MAKKKKKNNDYCDRCGAAIKSHFQIQLTPKKYISVCTHCFNWAMDKTQDEIKKDYKERGKK